MDHDLRTAPATLRRFPDGFCWVVACPYCGRRHTHGGGPLGGDPRQYLSVRVSHCHRGDYVLIERTRDTPKHGSSRCSSR
jgi:hypothetical protein